jgi:hypothetical protein
MQFPKLQEIAETAIQDPLLARAKLVGFRATLPQEIRMKLWKPEVMNSTFALENPTVAINIMIARTRDLIDGKEPVKLNLPKSWLDSV